MSRLLITGADGFVGRWLLPAALARGHQVVAAIAPDGTPPSEWPDAPWAEGIESVRADFGAADQVGALANVGADAVIHLAAVASGSAARQDPMSAWRVNVLGTAALVEALIGTDTRLLLVSTGEVYGREHHGPISESAVPAPCSPYAASKLAGEVAALEVWRRTGLPVIVARPFPHTGPGQNSRYVIPAMVSRLREVSLSGAATFPVGDLSPVRDFLDVRDVVQAYLALVETGTPGGIYNIASGTGRALADIVTKLAIGMGASARPVADPSLFRQADIPRLIGDASLLASTTGWSPVIPFDRTIQDLIDAQAH